MVQYFILKISLKLVFVLSWLDFLDAYRKMYLDKQHSGYTYTLLFVFSNQYALLLQEKGFENDE